MIEKNRRRRKARRHPHFVSGDPETFRTARLTANLTQKQAAAYLGVTQRTYQNWEAGHNRIPYPAFKLLRMRARAIVHVPLWEGWHFDHRGALTSPDQRVVIEPWELEQLELVFALARRYREQRAPMKAGAA